MSLPSPLPDDPRKWTGWKNYNSPNFYERLCLSVEQNPSNELIEDHTRQLLVWWQKKLPLKNQPSNPLAQILRDGLDNAPRYLAEARLGLCNPESRKKLDLSLLAVAKTQITDEFRRVFSIIAAGSSLSEDGEASLHRFGLKHGLTEEEIFTLIDEEMALHHVERSIKEVVPIPVITPNIPHAAMVSAGDPASEFKRLLRLSGLDSDSITDDQRDALINMAENLGLNGGDAEDIVDDFLEEIDSRPVKPGAGATTVAAPARPATSPARATVVVKPVTPVIAHGAPPRIVTPRLSPADERQKFSAFTNSVGQPMLLVPSGSFLMGSTDPEASPHESPRSKVNLSRFYMSRFPVTCAAYEQFLPSHRQNRGPTAQDNHPVVFVSSADALKFCQWLSQKEKKKYRLPSEAEWEYAARGTDERIYPWGNHLTNPGTLANFADANTKFSWSDPAIDDGYAETSPVGSYPRGASAFGIEDMAGNVWELCGDYFDAYKPAERTNPRGPMNGSRRVYRGGSWKSRFSSLRTSCRNVNTVDFRCNDLGFRVVCECE